MKWFKHYTDIKDIKKQRDSSFLIFGVSLVVSFIYLILYFNNIILNFVFIVGYIIIFAIDTRYWDLARRLKELELKK